MSGKAMNPIERAQAELDALEGKKQDGSQPTAAPSGEPAASAQPSAEPAVPPQSAPAGTPPAGAQPAADDGKDYKHLYQTLQGMHRSMQEQLTASMEQTRQLQEELKALRDGQLQPQNHDVGNTLPANATPAEIAAHIAILQEEYGDKFTGALRGFVRGEIVAEVERILSERLAPVQQRVENVEQSNTKTQQQLFAEALEKAAPGWEAITSQPAFGDWLKQTVDRASGQTFEALFVDANTKWDLNRLAWFINTFKQANQPPAPQPSAGDAQPSVDPREELLAPGRGHSATGGDGAPQSQPRVWTGADINAYYRDVRAGKYRGREAEAAAIEADIIRANAEGRYR